MARDWFVFVGPYAEWIRPGAGSLMAGSSGADRAEWERLLDGGVLAWNIGSDNGFPIEYEGLDSRRYCCMPEDERPGCPRWPMLFQFSDMRGECPEIATSWAALDRQGEIDWFRTAFAEELGRATRLLSAGPSFHWGLVHWIIP